MLLVVILYKISREIQIFLPSNLLLNYNCCSLQSTSWFSYLKDVGRMCPWLIVLSFTPACPCPCSSSITLCRVRGFLPLQFSSGLSMWLWDSFPVFWRSLCRTIRQYLRAALCIWTLLTVHQGLWARCCKLKQERVH